MEHTWWRAGSQLPDCADVSHRQAGGSHGPTLSNVKVTHGPPARCSHTLHYIYKVSTVMCNGQQVDQVVRVGLCSALRAV